MILYYPCITDMAVFSVPKLDPQVNILTVSLACPLCRTPLMVSDSGSFDHSALTNKYGGYSIYRLTATELFQASNGLGLPNGLVASLDNVRDCLVGLSITDIKAEEITDSRVLIHSITARRKTLVARTNTIKETEYCLDFATSTQGATIYRITKFTKPSEGTE